MDDDLPGDGHAPAFPQVAPSNRAAEASGIGFALTAGPGRSATLEELREYANDHTIFKRSHVQPALEQLHERCAITTPPRQNRIRPQTPKTVTILATGTDQGDLFGWAQ